MWQEEAIQAMFQSWVNKDAAALKQIISPEIVYLESDGRCYLGMGQVLKWFVDWNKQGTVLEWSARRFTHQDTYTLVEWFFKWDYAHVEGSVNGLSVVTFDDLHKIQSVREYQAKDERVYPYGQEPIAEEISSGAVASTTAFSEVKVIQYNKGDGSSRPLLRQQDLEAAGISMGRFEQRMFHAKVKGTLYGIRFQNEPRAQNKLVYCFRGKGYDYAVDLRKDSPTFGKSTCVEISAANGREIWIPKGFGHAFLALEDNTCMVCCYDQPYDDRYSRTVAWNDPELNIQYPLDLEVAVGEADANAPMLADCDIRL